MFDFAVVIPTVLRSSLPRAIRSVVNQTVTGSINIIIGIDCKLGDMGFLEELRTGLPENRTLTVISPGYSTSKARGGIYTNRYGGGIRTICSYAANSRYLAYLDDDNWFAPNHLETLAYAITGKQWAFSLRHYVDEDSLRPLGVDRWESVGPDAGVFNERYGGFCDTSTLMLDVASNIDLFPLWCISSYEDGSGEDRIVFDILKQREYGKTDLPTSYYLIHHTDGMHAKRLNWLRESGVQVDFPLPLSTILSEIQPAWPPGPDFPLMPLDAQGWGGSNSPAIAALLLEMKPKSIIEVGSWKGASAIFMCKTLKSIGIEPEMICVDTWLGGLDHLEQPIWREALLGRQGYPSLYYQFISNLFHQGVQENITPLPASSRVAAKFLRKRKLLVDFIYIDAGHEEDDVLEDLRLYWGLLKRGGVMMGDDYKPHVWPGVVRAVQRFANEIGATPIACGDLEYPQFMLRKDG